MRRKALVLGAGGHCRVLLSMLASIEQHEVLGIIDLGMPRANEVILGIAVIGTSHSLEGFQNRDDLDLFLAIGTNSLRESWWKTVQSIGFATPNLVSPYALVDPHARLGTANVICPNAFIGPDAQLGHNNLVNTAAVIEHEVHIGSHCHLAPSSTVCGRSVIGDRCLIGVGARVSDVIQVASGVTIGAGATVVRAITEADGIYIGTPAKRMASQ